MNEIRFNSFEPKNNEDNKLVPNKKESKILGTMKTFSKIILIILAIVVILFVYNNYSDKLFTKSTNINTNLFSAVFLSNGQVYFGKIESNKSGEMVLNNVFYLQSSNDPASLGESIKGSQFKLIKLGNELHGPTDQLFINKQNVLFYEYLREDSQVVQSIKNYK